MSHIEGVPLGTKIKRIGKAQYGDTIISDINRVTEWRNLGGLSYGVYVILEPDNVYNVLDLTAMEIPDKAYRRVAKDWFRQPLKGEYFLTVALTVVKHDADYFSSCDKRRIIVEPIKQVKRMMILRYEIKDNDHRSIFTVSEQTAQTWAKEHPDNCRIVEQEE